MLFPCRGLQHQKRQQKLEGRVTLDSLSSPSHTENKHTHLNADIKDEDNACNETHEEALMSEGNPEQISMPEQGLKNLDTKDREDPEEDEDSVTDCDSSAVSSVNNRFTVLSEEQHTKHSIMDDDKTSDMDQEGEEDTYLISEMEKATLDDAFIEDSDAVEQFMESEDEQLEAKEYTVVNQDPELAFHTLASRITPEKQDCSIKSCLFQFTEVETLTQNNSLLCLTCTKRHSTKDKAEGIGNFIHNLIVDLILLLMHNLSITNPVILMRQKSQFIQVYLWSCLSCFGYSS